MHGLHQASQGGLVVWRCHGLDVALVIDVSGDAGVGRPQDGAAGLESPDPDHLQSLRHGSAFIEPGEVAEIQDGACMGSYAPCIGRCGIFLAREHAQVLMLGSLKGRLFGRAWREVFEWKIKIAGCPFQPLGGVLTKRHEPNLVMDSHGLWRWGNVEHAVMGLACLAEHWYPDEQVAVARGAPRLPAGSQWRWQLREEQRYRSFRRQDDVRRS